MNYREISRVIIGIIEEKTGIVVKLEGGAGDTPAHPYCSFNITSPYLSIHNGIEEGGELTEDVELVFSFLFIGKAAYEVMGLTQSVAAHFKTPSTRQTLRDNDLVWVRNDGFGSRDTFLTVDTERRHGFDMRLRTRVTSSSTQELDYIESTEIQGGN